MENKTIIDISPVISRKTAVWPGDEKFNRNVSLDIKDGANITLSSITTTVHIGAHADAPSHYHKDGKAISEVQLSPYIGECQVIDCTGTKLIYPKHFEKQYKTGMKRVLFKTGSFPDHNSFNEDFASFSEEAVTFLANQNVELIGIDTPSVDPFSSKDLPAHQALYKFGLSNLEGLDLSHVEVGFYELIALPLRLEGLDASPVRAILRKL